MGLIPEDIINQVIDRCDIVEIIAAYTPLKRTGKNFKANCPFHNEKTPSFIVNPDKQIFHCFGCGVGGNVIAFVMKQEHWEFPEAVRFLAQKVNVVIAETGRTDQTARNERQQILDVLQSAVDYFHRQLLFEKNEETRQAREYLKARGVSLQTAQQFKLGFALNDWDALLKYLKEKNVSLALMEKAGLIIAREKAQGFYDRFRGRIMFPVSDTTGQCRAFGGRCLEDEAGGEDKNTAKYINSPETPVYTKGQHLYGLHEAKQAIVQQDEAVIVEGYMDCIMAHQEGVTNVIASLGTALTVEQIRLLRRFTKNVVMLFDMDTAGQAAVLRTLDILVEEDMQVKVAALSEGRDPDSFIREYGAQAFRERIQKAQTIFDYKFSFLTKLYDIKTLEGKAKLAQEMLITIGKFDNAILKNGYLKRLAQNLGVAENVLNSELVRLDKGSEKEAVRIGNIPPGPSAHSVETHILKLLLEEESFIGPTKEEIEPSDFNDHRIRAVIERIYDLFEQGKRINIGSLISQTEDQDLQQFISSLVAEEESWAADKKKMHRDFIERIKMNRLKSLRQGLLEQIREAEGQGDHPRLDDLKEKYTQLTRRL